MKGRGIKKEIRKEGSWIARKERKERANEKRKGRKGGNQIMSALLLENVTKREKFFFVHFGLLMAPPSVRSSANFISIGRLRS